MTTGEVRPRGHLCGQSGAQALPLEDGSPFPCLSLCRQLREHTQRAPRAGGGAGNCFCATHPGLLPEAASLPGTAEAPGSAIRGLCQRSVVQWETDSAASCSHCLGLLLLCFSLSVKRIPQLHLQPSADSGPELLL